MTGVPSLTEADDFSSSLCIQTSSEAHPASCPMSARGLLPRSKAWLGREADHSPPSSAEAENELELYLLSPQAPSWHVVGHLYLFTFYLCLGLLSGLFPSGFLTKIFYAFAFFISLIYTVEKSLHNKLYPSKTIPSITMAGLCDSNCNQYRTSCFVEGENIMTAI
jgi:hypothetical protein